MGHGAGIECGFATGELAGFACGFACLRGDDALEAELLCFRGVFFEPVVERVLDGAGDEGLDLGVEELLFGLVVEGWVGELDGDDGNESFAEVVAGWVRVLLFEDARAFGVAVEGSGEGGFEALAVGAAVGVVDVVGECEEAFVVAVMILEGDLADHGLFFDLLAEEDG